MRICFHYNDVSTTYDYDCGDQSHDLVAAAGRYKLDDELPEVGDGHHEVVQ